MRAISKRFEAGSSDMHMTLTKTTGKNSEIHTIYGICDCIIKSTAYPYTTSMQHPWYGN
jgi:hypothetical protein